MEPVGHDEPIVAASTTHEPLRACCVAPVDVDRPGHRRGDRGPAGGIAPVRAAVAAPILLLWFVSPGIAWWISRPLVRREARLTREQALFLRKLARRTWAFFETFVGPDDQWLPPDNLQEHPVAVVAHRTSPTNIGLALLANLTAYDFGYIPAGQLLARTAKRMARCGDGAARGALLQLVRHGR